jgi:hypothetical protein
LVVSDQFRKANFHITSGGFEKKSSGKAEMPSSWTKPNLRRDSPNLYKVPWSVSTEREIGEYQLSKDRFASKT